MKKKFMFIALTTLFSMGVFLTSCEEDGPGNSNNEEEEISCYCVFYNDDGERYHQDIYDATNYGETDCDDLEFHIDNHGYGWVDCEDD